MIEVSPNLFVGSQDDLPEAETQEFYIIHAAKEPWHRKTLGYAPGKAAPKSDPRYLVSVADDGIALNLIDAADVAYIPHELVNTALRLTHEKLVEFKVLIHCNQGKSRAPSIALLYLARYTNALSGDYGQAMHDFKRLYPDYAPAQGMADFVRLNWATYAHEKTEAA